jgi:hypothetical protein
MIYFALQEKISNISWTVGIKKSIMLLLYIFKVSNALKSQHDFFLKIILILAVIYAWLKTES